LGRSSVEPAMMHDLIWVGFWVEVLALLSVLAFMTRNFNNPG
jgi:hypothetical protein